MRNLTRQAMADSLRTLLRERPLSRISVRDITEGCHVNRQTFYYHFRDVYDLMFWMSEQDLITYLEENRVNRTDLREYTYALFGLFYANRRIIRNAYDPVNRIQYETLFTEYALPRIRDYIQDHRGNHAVIDEDVDFIAAFYTQALSGSLIKWIERGMPDENKAQLDKFCTLVDGGLDHILEKFEASTK